MKLVVTICGVSHYFIYQNGLTPVQYAARAGHMELIELLRDDGVSMNSVNEVSNALT